MKERILQRIHRALEHRPGAALPDPLPPTVSLTADQAAELFTTRLTGNGGEVYQLPQLEVAAWLAQFAAPYSGIALGATLPSNLAPPLPQLPPDQAPLGISWALGAIAETGSVLLSSQDGRRTQLLPPHHVVLVPPGRLFDSLAVAFAQLPQPLPAAIGLHSGPSKSADIGQIMVKGVHGPGKLVVVLLS